MLARHLLHVQARAMCQLKDHFESPLVPRRWIYSGTWLAYFRMAGIGLPEGRAGDSEFLKIAGQLLPVQNAEGGEKHRE